MESEAAVQAGDAGIYRAVIRNARGAVTSAPAVLGVLTGPPLVATSSTS